MAVARLADDLRAAGAEGVTRIDEPPVRLVWTTADASAIEAVCARHRRVVVGVERFETLGAELERLVVRGADATLLERRAFGDEELAPLNAGALRRAALGVAAVPVTLGPGLAGTSLDDALLVGPAIGRLCDAAGDPLAADPPPPAAVDAVRALAAVALTVGANASAPASDGELAFERSWRLAQATAFAAQAAWWARPDDEDWPEWLMFLLSCAAGVVESCAACLHRPPPDVKSLIAEHHPTADEQLEHAAGLLAIVALQALALFDT